MYTEALLSSVSAWQSEMQYLDALVIDHWVTLVRVRMKNIDVGSCAAGYQTYANIELTTAALMIMMRRRMMNAARVCVCPVHID